VSGLRRRLGRIRRSLRADPLPQTHPELLRLTDEDRRQLTSLHDDTVPLPPEAAELNGDHPRLVELRGRYTSLDLPVLVASRWNEEAVRSFLDLRYFRGETLIVWHYRELPRITKLKYFIFLKYVADRDRGALLDRLVEDGAFGCWAYRYADHPLISRDLLESVNEIEFLERELSLSEREAFRVLDIGAGYGRLAHRMTEAYANLADYCCVDAVPESTFLSEFYLQYRGCTPPARVLPLDEVEQSLRPGQFDLAINIHSFPECTYDAVQWWLELVGRLEIPNLLIVPNEPDELLTLEPDGSRRDFAPLVSAAGYRLVKSEPVIDDQAARDLLRLEDRFLLFRRDAP
jgi:hypothetical protein